jgi:hypothetical protein
MEPNIFSDDLYARLGLPRNATEEEIKSRYRHLALRFHPDKNPGDHDAAEKFKRLAEAYEILMDKQKRAVYDRGDWRRGAGGDAAGGAPFAHRDPREVFESVWGAFFHELFHRVPTSHAVLAVAGSIVGGLVAHAMGAGTSGVALWASAAPIAVVAMHLDSIAESFGALTDEEREMLKADIRLAIELLNLAARTQRRRI